MLSEGDRWGVCERNQTGNYEAALGAGVESRSELDLKRQLREQRSLWLRELVRCTLGHLLKSDPEQEKGRFGRQGPGGWTGITLCKGSEVPIGQTCKWWGKKASVYWELELRRNRFGTQHIGPQAGADPHFVELNKLPRAQFKKNITNYECEIIHENVRLGRALWVRGPGACFIGVMEIHLAYMHFWATHLLAGGAKPLKI